MCFGHVDANGTTTRENRSDSHFSVFAHILKPVRAPLFALLRLCSAFIAVPLRSLNRQRAPGSSCVNKRSITWGERCAHASPCAPANKRCAQPARLWQRVPVGESRHVNTATLSDLTPTHHQRGLWVYRGQVSATPPPLVPELVTVTVVHVPHF